jgi:hypothetical protein
MAYNDYGLSSMWTPTPAPVKQESMANMKNEAVRGAYLDYQLDQAVKTGLITEGEREAMRKGYLQAQQPQQANTLVKPPSTQPLSPVPPVNGLLPPTRGPGTGGPMTRRGTRSSRQLPPAVLMTRRNTVCCRPRLRMGLLNPRPRQINHLLSNQILSKNLSKGVCPPTTAKRTPVNPAPGILFCLLS